MAPYQYLKYTIAVTTSSHFKMAPPDLQIRVPASGPQKFFESSCSSPTTPVSYNHNFHFDDIPKQQQSPQHNTPVAAPHPVVAPSTSDKVGCVLNSTYYLAKVLGSGACGTVYYAKNIKNGTDVAIKTMLKPAPGHSMGAPLPIPEDNGFDMLQSPQRRWAPSANAAYRQNNIKATPINFAREQIERFQRYQQKTGTNHTMKAINANKALLNEVGLHSYVHSHKNILPILEVLDSHDYLFVVLEYCPLGDLFTAITERNWYVGDEEYVKLMFSQLLDAIEFCHKNGVYHCDLKPENIMVYDHGQSLRIADFGLASKNPICTVFGRGSSYYMAPETIPENVIYRQVNNPEKEGQHITDEQLLEVQIKADLEHRKRYHNQKRSKRPLQSKGYPRSASDVWALGVILLNLIFGRNPWKKASLVEDPAYRDYSNNPETLKGVLPVSHELNQIMAQVFHPDPYKRIKIPELRAWIHRCANLTDPTGDFPWFQPFLKKKPSHHLHNIPANEPVPVVPVEKKPINKKTVQVKEIPKQQVQSVPQIVQPTPVKTKARLHAKVPQSQVFYYNNPVVKWHNAVENADEIQYSCESDQTEEKHYAPVQQHIELDSHGGNVRHTIKYSRIPNHPTAYIEVNAAVDVTQVTVSDKNMTGIVNPAHINEVSEESSSQSVSGSDSVTNSNGNNYSNRTSGRLQNSTPTTLATTSSLVEGEGEKNKAHSNSDSLSTGSSVSFEKGDNTSDQADLRIVIAEVDASLKTDSSPKPSSESVNPHPRNHHIDQPKNIFQYNQKTPAGVDVFPNFHNPQIKVPIISISSPPPPPMFPMHINIDENCSSDDESLDLDMEIDENSPSSEEGFDLDADTSCDTKFSANNELIDIISKGVSSNIHGTSSSASTLASITGPVSNRLIAPIGVQYYNQRKSSSLQKATPKHSDNSAFKTGGTTFARKNSNFFGQRNIISSSDILESTLSEDSPKNNTGSFRNTPGNILFGCSNNGLDSVTVSKKERSNSSNRKRKVAGDNFKSEDECHSSGLSQCSSISDIHMANEYREHAPIGTSDFTNHVTLQFGKHQIGSTPSFMNSSSALGFSSVYHSADNSSTSLNNPHNVANAAANAAVATAAAVAAFHRKMEQLYNNTQVDDMSRRSSRDSTVNTFGSVGSFNSFNTMSSMNSLNSVNSMASNITPVTNGTNPSPSAIVGQTSMHREPGGNGPHNFCGVSGLMNYSYYHGAGAHGAAYVNPNVVSGDNSNGVVTGYAGYGYYSKYCGSFKRFRSKSFSSA